MGTDRLSDAWLFREHSKGTVMRWVNSLHYFHFKRAWGGHANDGDEFEARFSYSNEEDLLEMMDKLGIQLNNLPEYLPQPIPGKAYSPEEYAEFKNSIKRFTHLVQPGHSIVAGHKVFVWVYDDVFSIAVIDTTDPYHVSERNYEACLELEKYFDLTGFSEFLDKTEKNACYISKQKYPELFVTDM